MLPDVNETLQGCNDQSNGNVNQLCIHIPLSPTYMYIPREKAISDYTSYLSCRSVGHSTTCVDINGHSCEKKTETYLSVYQER